MSKWIRYGIGGTIVWPIFVIVWDLLYTTEVYRQEYVTIACILGVISVWVGCWAFVRGKDK